MKRRTLLTGGTAILALGSRAAFAQEAEADAETAPEIAEMMLGNADAPVEVIEYASFTCPHCASFHANQFKQVKANYIDTDQIKFVYREVYFDRPGLWASMIARFPGSPEFFFAFSDKLYARQQDWLASGDPSVIIEELRTLAKTEGMDDAALDECLSDAATAEALYTWYQSNAETDGITSTPSFLIDGENYSNMNYADFAAILDDKIG